METRNQKIKPLRLNIEEVKKNIRVEDTQRTPMPSILKYKLMSYCRRTGLYYDNKANYIIWHHRLNDDIETTHKTYRVFIEYHKMKSGKELIFGHNRKADLRINFSFLFQIDNYLGMFKDKGLITELI